MADTRSPFPSAPPAKREVDMRAQFERPKQWMPPQMLPDPHTEEGYKFRWIRVATLGNDDPMNISSKLREGWEPVKASDHPEIQLMSGGSSRFPDSIEVGGLLLCKTPTEFVKQRDAHFQQQTDNQMLSIDNNLMRENDPRMPLFKERSTKVSFGKGM
jgi:hypothetical protein